MIGIARCGRVGNGTGPRRWVEWVEGVEVRDLAVAAHARWGAATVLDLQGTESNCVPDEQWTREWCRGGGKWPK